MRRQHVFPLIYKKNERNGLRSFFLLEPNRKTIYMLDYKIGAKHLKN